VFEKSLDCVKKIKASFTKVGANLPKKTSYEATPKALLNGSVEKLKPSKKFEVIAGMSGRFFGARGISDILEKAECDHIKTVA
jgi:hypothetical protein